MERAQGHVAGLCTDRTRTVRAQDPSVLRPITSDVDSFHAFPLGPHI